MISLIKNYIPYDEIVAGLNKEIRSVTNNMVIKEQMNTKQQPPYPFGTYTITNPYLNAKTYNQNNVEITQSVEIMISYTFYSLNSFESNGIMQRVITNFNHRGTNQVLWLKGIHIVDIIGVGNRDTFLTIETERRCGFDLRVRYVIKDSKDLQDIGIVEDVGENKE